MFLRSQNRCASALLSAGSGASGQLLFWKRKRGLFRSMTVLFSAKNGQNRGLVVTDRLIGNYAKLLIICQLQIVERSETCLRRGGGWGSTFWARQLRAISGRSVVSLFIPPLCALDGK